MLQYFSMTAGSARQCMFDTGLGDINVAPIPNVGEPWYLLVVKDLDSNKEVSKYKEGLDDWYLDFVLDTPSIFEGLNDLDNSSYPDLVKPVGIYAKTVWCKAGRQFSITVTKALPEMEEASDCDVVDVCICTPSLPRNYQAYKYFFDKVSLREKALKDFSAMNHLAESGKICFSKTLQAY
jgi:hypothetical protein